MNDVQGIGPPSQIAKSTKGIEKTIDIRDDEFFLNGYKVVPLRDEQGQVCPGGTTTYLSTMETATIPDKIFICGKLFASNPGILITYSSIKRELPVVTPPNSYVIRIVSDTREYFGLGRTTKPGIQNVHKQGYIYWPDISA